MSTAPVAVAAMRQVCAVWGHAQPRMVQSSLAAIGASTRTMSTTPALWAKRGTSPAKGKAKHGSKKAKNKPPSTKAKPEHCLQKETTASKEVKGEHCVEASPEMTKEQWAEWIDFCRRRGVLPTPKG